MKKLNILIIAFLIALSICTFAGMQAKAAITLSLNPTSGPVGTTVTVSGSGYLASHSIQITYDGSLVTATTSTNLGSIPSGVSFSVPASVAGSNTVAATDGTNTQQATFTVTSAFSLSPTSGAVGSSVTVTATGMLGSHSVTATFGGAAVTLSPSTTSSSGGLSATFTVPASASGAQMVTLTDGTNSPSPATFTVTSAFSLSPTSGAVGSSVTVTGSGFAASSIITIQFDGVTQTTSPATVTTDTLGSFSGVTFTVPSSTVGSHTVSATDVSSNSASAAFVVNVGSATNFVVSSSTSQVAGTAFSVTVTAKDANNNTVTGYVGTVAITSSDSKAILPANYVFQASDAGIHSFNVTLKTAGSQSITATDAASGSINGSQTGITVSHASAVANVVISPAVSSLTAGLNMTFSATASDTYGNTWDVTPSTTWTISAGAGGSWSSNVYTSATASSWTITGTYNSAPYTTALTVNPAGLDHFVFNTVGTQTAGFAFSITVTAKDAYGNTVTGYTGSPSLTVSAGSISPTTMNAFVGGVGSTSVTLTASGSGVTITATDGTHTGTSNSFTVTAAPTPSPTPTPIPNASPTPSPTSTPINATTPTPTQSPTPTPSGTYVAATTADGTTVDLAISGNVTISQISNVIITSSQPNATTTVSFTITGTTGATGFSNMTIPKPAIPYGTTPVVYIDGQPAPNQGYTQDANNFYVWYTTQFSTDQVVIQFTGSLTSKATFGPVLAVAITVPEIILVYAVIAFRRLKRKL